MNISHLHPPSELLAGRLACDEDYRILRKVPTPFANMPQDGAPPDGRCLALVDLETTGLAPDEDKMLELAIQLVWIDERFGVVGHMPPLSWLEDPDQPIPANIRLLTGITSEMVRGRHVNDAMACDLLDRADLLVAHHAKFEISWLERRYPALAGRAWACSMKDINWLHAGFDGRGQQSLLAQHGLFSTAHRAAADVWSLFVLLSEERRDVDGGPLRSHLERLVTTADTDTVRVEASGAPFSAKDQLRSCGYRWDAGKRVWWTEVACQAVEREEAWFYRSGLPMPSLSPITARERHR